MMQLNLGQELNELFGTKPPTMPMIPPKSKVKIKKPREKHVSKAQLKHMAEVERIKQSKIDRSTKLKEMVAKARLKAELQKELT